MAGGARRIDRSTTGRRATNVSEFEREPAKLSAQDLSGISQLVALEFAGLGSGKHVHEFDLARRLERRDLRFAELAQFLGLFRRRSAAVDEYDEGFHVVRLFLRVALADDGDFLHVSVRYQRLF